MGLKPDLVELLSGFEKRMKFVNIPRFLMDYPYKDNIRAMIPDREVLDNLIVAVLVFIKERTLGSEQRCTLENVADFLADLSPVLPADCSVAAEELARFIVVDVLQKGGVLTNYKVLCPEREQFEQMPIRLIEEDSGTYHLTDDAFDYLFRSKEIESELDYSVTRFRMAEYMKRNNYTEALDQSRELVSKIRNMKVSIDDFMRRCRENIARISVDQYEAVIGRVRSLLETEYEELKMIQDNARTRAEDLSKALSSGVDAENVLKHRRALAEIIRNIQLTIEEQRSLINRKMAMSEAYRSVLSDSYAMTRFERLSFDRDIMSKLRNGELPLVSASAFLLFPLTTPEFEKRFSLENLYAIQNRISELEDESPMEFGEDTAEEDPVQTRNERFLGICRALFSFLKGRDSFRISEFVASLSDELLYDFCKESALPQVILGLYALQNVSISDWKGSVEMIVPPVGEFELPWCLSELPPDLLAFDSFAITNPEGAREFSFSVRHDGQQNRISMSDFLIEVKR